MSRKPWFGRKRIGFGWRPVTWQGWLLILVIVAVAILARLTLVHH
jgi:hypothetical protein